MGSTSRSLFRGKLQGLRLEIQRRTRLRLALDVPLSPRNAVYSVESRWIRILLTRFGLAVYSTMWNGVNRRYDLAAG
jgi:hypothetical protein